MMRRSILLAATALILAAFPPLVRAQEVVVTATVSACFVPGPVDCANVVAGEIDHAASTVRMQAYWLTSKPIMASLVRAKNRGVDVQVILDKSQDRVSRSGSRYNSSTFLRNAGIPVYIDFSVAIAHSKVVVIDDREVITGSFNFTTSADTRNAENFVVLGSPALARQFSATWDARKAVSEPLQN